MKILRVKNDRSGADVASSVEVADRWWRRARGLLARRSLEPGEGLLLVPCGSVHTLGMRFPIDVVFLDDENYVVSTREGVEPGRMALGGRGARATLELRAGRLVTADTRPGDRLIFEEEIP